MGGPAQLSDSAVATVLQGSPHLFSIHMQGERQCSDVCGVDKSYYQGVLDWVPLIEMGDWSVHMDR